MLVLNNTGWTILIYNGKYLGMLVRYNKMF